MRLQSDPTIIYGVFGGKGKPDGYVITVEPIATRPRPYNTYTIDGLPPGPIANPGRASLEAVANPSRTRDLFFVADGSGGHAFAETYEEHLRNVARWRADRCARHRSAGDADGRGGRARGRRGRPAPPRSRTQPAAPTSRWRCRNLNSKRRGPADSPTEARAGSARPGLSYSWGRLADGA